MKNRERRAAQAGNMRKRGKMTSGLDCRVRAVDRENIRW